MQEQHYNELQDKLSDRLSDAIPETTSQSVRTRVAREFERIKAEGLLDSLTPDEVAILRDYRDWKVRHLPRPASLHWRKRQ